MKALIVLMLRRSSTVLKMTCEQARLSISRQQVNVHHLRLNYGGFLVCDLCLIPVCCCLILFLVRRREMLQYGNKAFVHKLCSLNKFILIEAMYPDNENTEGAIQLENS